MSAIDEGEGLPLRQMEIVVRVMLGRTLKEICIELEIEITSVREHIRAIYRQTDVDTISELFQRYRVRSGA